MRKLFITLLTLSALLIAAPVEAQIATPSPSPSASFTQTVGLTEVAVSFSRPSMKGRTIFGGLVPFDKVWRTGANGATTISFSDDVKIEGNEVKAGKYALYTIPGKDSWTVMLYSDLSMGGNVAAYDKEKEVVRFMVTPQTLPFAVESFLISFDDLTSESANIYLVWEKTMVSMKLEVAVDSKVMSMIETTMAGPSANDYYAAATYYYNTDRDMVQALAWVNTCLEMGGDRFWIMTMKARILGKMGNKNEAISTSQKAMAMAKEAKNDDYVKINQDLIAEWSK